MSFNLDQFEYHVYSKNYENASRDLIQLLNQLDSSYGVLSDISLLATGAVTAQEMHAHVLTRVTSAISALLVDKNYDFAPEWQSSILGLHRWLSALFSASNFRNADHVIRALRQDNPNESEVVSIDKEHLFKLCMLYTPESELPLNLDEVWNLDPLLAVSLCISLVSPRYLGDSSAHTKREKILPWLTEKLPLIEDLERLPIRVLHDVYMHCSYADRLDKHQVKRPINQLIRKYLLSKGLTDNFYPATFNKGVKPTLVIVLEWFTAGHSIYRTHSLAIEGAREFFHVVGVGHKKYVDDETVKVFDEFIEIEPGDVLQEIHQIKNLIQEKEATIFYMPSIGMSPLTIFLSNLRLAPLQMVALGHPATTHSEFIDYVVVEEDYVGDPKCFSEKLLVLPKDGMPYRPSKMAEGLSLERKLNFNPNVVNVCLCATTMKLNPSFMEVCKEILNQSKKPIHFHFLIGQAQGLTFIQVERLAKQYLGDSVTVYPHQPYSQYMSVISSCDLFINPFPFGNTNGIVDVITCGLVGVCKTGREVHEHIDEGLFKRLNFPTWLIAETNQDYVSATIRLIEDQNLRSQLARDCSGKKNLKIIFGEKNTAMGQLMKTALLNQVVDAS